MQNKAQFLAPQSISYSRRADNVPYPHDHRADNAPYPHHPHADKARFPHDHHADSLSIFQYKKKMSKKKKRKKKYCLESLETSHF